MAALTVIGGLCFLSLTSYAEQVDQRRSLEMELEEVPGSTGYEVEVTRLLSDGKRSPPKTFKLQTTIWKATLLPGHYEMRVRSIDSRQVPGDWTSPKNFVIKLFPPELISPKDTEEIKSDDGQKEGVKFQWSPVNRAKKYKLTVLTSKGDIAFEEVTSDPKTSAKIPVAAEYTWHVLPTTEDEGDSDPSSDFHFKVIGKKLDYPSIEKISGEDTMFISWKPVEFATTYNAILEFKNKSGEYKEILNKILTSTKLQFKTPLKTGSYRFKVKASAEKRLDSDFSNEEFSSFGFRDEELHRAGYQTKGPSFVRIAMGPSAFSYWNFNNGYNSNTSFSTRGVSGTLSLGTWFTERSKWGIVGTLETEDVPYLNSNNFYNTVGLQGVRKFNFGGGSRGAILTATSFIGLVDKTIPLAESSSTCA